MWINGVSDAEVGTAKPPSDVATYFCFVNCDNPHIYSNVEFKNINANGRTLFNFKCTIYKLISAVKKYMHSILI